MAELAGKTGALYYSTGTIRATTISATGTSDLINDSGSGFVNAGFVAGDKIVASGFTEASNNGLHTIAGGGVAAGVLTLSGATLVTEAAGDIVTIVTAPDDAQLLGFFSWTIDTTTDLTEITAFEDGIAGGKVYLPTLVDWTATAERYWLTNQNLDSFLGTQKWVRFFVKWVATPSGGDPSYYYEGMCEVNGNSIETPVGDVVKETLTFQGDGALTLVTRTSAWDT